MGVKNLGPTGVINVIPMGVKNPEPALVMTMIPMGVKNVQPTLVKKMPPDVIKNAVPMGPPSPVGRGGGGPRTAVQGPTGASWETISHGPCT